MRESITALCMRETDNNFYLALSRPLSERSPGYKRLSHMAITTPEVRHLECGSQVFVYPRKDFSIDDILPDSQRRISDADLFEERVILETQQLGKAVAIDPVMHPVERKIPPAGGRESLIIV